MSVTIFAENLTSVAGMSEQHHQPFTHTTHVRRSRRHLKHLEYNYWTELTLVGDILTYNTLFALEIFISLSNNVLNSVSK